MDQDIEHGRDMVHTLSTDADWGYKVEVESLVNSV